MERPIQPNTPERRDRAQAWLRRATRATLLGATGAAAVIGVVVAQEHPGSGAGTTSGGTGATGSGTAGSSSSNSGNSGNSSAAAGSSGSSDTGSSGNTGTTGGSGNTGNTGAPYSPSISRSSPAVTSGGTSR